MPVSPERRRQLRQQRQQKVYARPENGFMRFRKDVSTAVARDGATINQNQLSKILGKLWMLLEPEERNSFEWHHELLQALHANTASNRRHRHVWLGGNFVLIEYHNPPN